MITSKIPFLAIQIASDICIDYIIKGVNFMFTKNEMSRLYDNKLQQNIVTFDKEIKKELNTKVKSLLVKVATMNAHKKQLVVIVTAQEKDEIREILGKVLFLDDTSIISTGMLNKAVVSAMKNKLVTSAKNVKQEGWAYSVSDFLKSLNASIVKRLEKVQA